MEVAATFDYVAQEIERRLPLFCGIAAGCLFYLFGADVLKYASDNQWKIEQLYAAVFNISAITTGILFAFYGIVATTATDFIKKMRKTQAFSAFRVFLRNAIYLGFVLAIITVPFMVIEPKPVSRASDGYTFVAAWVGYATATLVSFYRVTRMFLVLAEDVPERPYLGG